MNKKTIHRIITAYLKNYDPEKVGIFGSYARSEYNSDSDIDILVKFKETKSLLELVKIENELSEKLGIKVDLVTEGAIKNMKIKEYINHDMILLIDNGQRRLHIH